MSCFPTPSSTFLCQLLKNSDEPKLLLIYWYTKGRSFLYIDPRNIKKYARTKLLLVGCPLFIILSNLIYYLVSN